MKRLFSILLILGSLCLKAQHNGPSAHTKGAAFPEASVFAGKELSYKVIPAVNNTFCYDIYANGKLMIHQPSKPGMQGNEGFKTKEQAQSVAGLVIAKIKKGIMPPSVTTDELQKLKAI